MFRFTGLPLLGAVLLMFGAGCNVLEDRSVCTSTLTVDLQEVDRTIKEWQMWLFNTEGELIYKDTIYRRSYGTRYTVEVPRYDDVQCLLWGNIRGATSLNEAYSLGTFMLKGHDISADSLYFCTDRISTNGEESYLKVVPNKEFATVDIYMKGWVGHDYDATLELLCANSGFFVDKRICGSNTVTKMEVYDIGNYYTHFRGRILRQYDVENLVLSLFITDRLPDGARGGVRLNKEIPLGEYLESNGYSMQSGAMGDISMEVDLSYNKLLVRAEDWSATYKLVEEI